MEKIDTLFPSPTLYERARLLKKEWKRMGMRASPTLDK